MPDPWTVLGIEPSATYDEARRAFVIRTQLLHPDRHHGSRPEVLAAAEQAMRELNEAWEMVRSGLPGTEQVVPATPPPGHLADPAAALEWVLARMMDAAHDSGEPLSAAEVTRLRMPVAGAPTGRAFDRWLGRRRTTLRRATAQGDPADWSRAMRLLNESPQIVLLRLLRD